MAQVKKISDKNFFAILRENGGLYARTGRAIAKKYNIEYSRQAVRIRAEKKPDILQDIDEENLDVAEEGLYTLMRSAAEQIKLRAIELYLKTKGKRRGYVERQEFTGPDGSPLNISFHLDKDSEPLSDG